MTLSGAQKRYLRGLAHPLSPIVHVGKEGVSEAVVSATDAALTDHELIKVRLPPVERGVEKGVKKGVKKGTRKELAGALGTGTGAEVAGIIGRVAILYRAHPEEPVISLP